MQPLAEYLSWYRAQESHLTLAMLVDDPSARRVLVAWCMYARIPEWVPTCDPPSDERKRWEWLWEPLLPLLDMEDLAIVCGLAPFALDRKMRQLINARLMYPDGTITIPAEAAIKAKTAGSLPKKATKPK